LIDPERDSAKYYVDAALALDPNSTAVLEVRGDLAAAILSQAHGAIDRRDFPRAAALIDGANGIAAPANIGSAQDLLANARHLADSDAWETLLKNAAERMQQDRLIEPANDSAKYFLQTLSSLDPNHPGLPAAIQELGGRLVSKARRAMNLQQFSAAESWLGEAAGIGFVSAEMNAVRHDLEAAAAIQSNLTDIVPASTLSLLKSVQPKYPRKALRDKAEGWVELDFTVSEAGFVKDLAMHAASNPGVFDDAATKAVAQWRFQPVLRGGKPAAVRTRVRIRFTLP
jgi:protein TonB